MNGRKKTLPHNTDRRANRLSLASGLLFFIFHHGIPLAMSGLLNPMIAVLAMFAGSWTVIGNTLRLYPAASKN